MMMDLNGRSVASTNHDYCIEHAHGDFIRLLLATVW